MKKYVIEKIKNENGAVTLLVFITVLTFVAILLGAYLTVTTLQKSQLESDIRIQEIYGADVERVDQIYEELAATDLDKPSCNITSDIENDIAVNCQFTFSESIKNFEVNDIKVNNLSVVNTGLTKELQLSTSNPAYVTTTLNKGKTYIILFDYKCITDFQDFAIGLYSETNADLPTTSRTATSQLKHENFRITISEDEVKFKISADIEDSNNITIPNFEVFEVQDTQAEKGSFTKVNDLEYMLMFNYEKDSRYAVIIEKDLYEDLNGNKNDEIIYVI